MMHYQQLGRTSVRDSLRALEIDVQHANELAAEIPSPKGSRGIQMKLVYNHIAPFILFFLGWFDCSLCCFLPRYLNFVEVLIYKVYSDDRPTISTYGRKASVKEFYAVILPSLEQLHDSVELEEIQGENSVHRSSARKRTEAADPDGASTSNESDRDDECGICLEPRPKVVLPSCCHAMCINCFRDWCDRSESCPFCRGCLRRVMSEDLWVLTSKEEVADTKTISSENVHRFYEYIRKLPKDGPDAMFVMYYEYLI